MLAFAAGSAMAANAAPISLDTPTSKFVAYCEANDTDCALYIDTVLIQFFWGIPANGPACKDPPTNFQAEDGRNLILPWIRANGFTTDPLKVSLARATIALTGSLCPQNK
jgi:hypothetical protein